MAVIVVIHRIQGRLLCLSQVYTYALKPCFSTGCMQQQVLPSTHSTTDDASPWLGGAGGPSSQHYHQQQQQQEQQQEQEQLQGGVITSWELHLVMEYCDQVGGGGVFDQMQQMLNGLPPRVWMRCIKFESNIGMQSDYQLVPSKICCC
jgi:hypothetical protein